MKKTLVFALILAALLGLWGCTQTGQPEEALHTGPSESSAPVAIPTDPTHIYEEVREDILIDAEVIRPEGDAIPKVYLLQKPDITQSKVEAFLAACDDRIVNVEEDHTEDNYYVFSGRCEKGGAAIINKNLDVNAAGCNFSYATPEYEWYSSVCGFSRDRSINFVQDLRSGYQPAVFAFATPEEAETEVRQILEALGLHDLLLEDTYCLDYETMAAAEQEYARDFNALFQDYGETYQCKDRWTEADNCYMFFFAPGAEGIPAIRGWVLTPTVSIGTSVSVVYNSGGVVSVTVETALNVAEPVETPKALVSATEAMKTASEIVSNVYTGRKQVIEEIALRYYPVQDHDRWLFTPVWEVFYCAKDVKKADGQTFDDYSYLLIDAITGKEI